MVQTQLKFQVRSKVQKARNYREVQDSVNLLFSILDEYTKLEKIRQRSHI